MTQTIHELIEEATLELVIGLVYCNNEWHQL